MTKALAALFALLFSAVLAHAAPNQSPSESQLNEHGHYTNSDGQSVHSPAHFIDGKAPAGATAKCRDGTYSFSKHRSGTCSGHHGVAEWQ
jgi:hypothetical protein